MKFSTLGGCLAMLLLMTQPAQAADATSAEAVDTPRPATAIETAMQSVVTISYGAEEDDPDGSGFVVDASGIIVTNTHVVPPARGDSVRVSFADGSSYDGQVIGRDPRTDLAVVRIKADRPLVALELAASSRAGLGTKVFALGSPMGKRFSVTSGIISGYDRAYDTAWPVNFLQHDAALNPGNSGGPLIDEQGRVLGVNTATPPETMFDMGIGLSVPAELVAKIVPQLVALGKIDRGALGVKVSSADSGMAGALGAPGRKGLLIDEVLAAGAAEKAGLRAGDLILSIRDLPTALARDLSIALLDSRPGELVTVEIVRDGRMREVAVLLGKDDPFAGERGRVATLSLNPVAPEEPGRPFGITFAERDGAIYIASVDEGSLAQLYGVYEGDKVLALNGKAPGGIGEFEAKVGAIEGGIAVLRIEREGMGTFHVAFPLSPEAAASRRPGQQKYFPQGPL